MLGNDYPVPRVPRDDGRGQLSRMRTLLRGADVAFGNLEGVLADGLPPAKHCGPGSQCYVFRSPTRFGATFADAGFDVMSLANNHARDFGEEGRNSSMRALDQHRIAHSGRAGDVARWTAAGKRIALAAFAPNIGCNSLNDIPAAVQLVQTLARESDLVFVSMHAGAEGTAKTHVVRGKELFLGENRGDVVAFAHAVIDAGADLVIGHGPHVPRAVELYKGRLVAYSLGNFSTWEGMNIAGVIGYAPVLEVALAGDGSLVQGHLHSNTQQRPAGVVPDPRQAAARLMRQLTQQDFGGGGLTWTSDASFKPVGRGF